MTPLIIFLSTFVPGYTSSAISPIYKTTSEHDVPTRPSLKRWKCGQPSASIIISWEEQTVGIRGKMDPGWGTLRFQGMCHSIWWACKGERYYHYTWIDASKVGGTEIPAWLILSWYLLKVRGGYISQSVRSITSTDLKRLYEKNYDYPIHRLGEAPINANDDHWGGGRLRLMLNAIYSIAFLCLLRFDEALKIQAHHLEVVDEGKGEIKLTLPFRKTHNTGGTDILVKSLLTTIKRSSHFTSFTILKSGTWIQFMRFSVGFINLVSKKATSSVVSVRMTESLQRTNHWYDARPVQNDQCPNVSHRVKSFSLNISATIYWIYQWTSHLMALIPSGGVGVNIYPHKGAGGLGNSVTGEDGVLILTVSPSFAI